MKSAAQSMILVFSRNRCWCQIDEGRGKHTATHAGTRRRAHRKGTAGERVPLITGAVKLPPRDEEHTRPVPVRTLAEVLASDARFQRRRLTAGKTLLPHALEHEVLAVLDGALAIEVNPTHSEVQILEVVGPSAGMLNARLLAEAHPPAFLRALVPATLVSLSERELGRLLEADGLLACGLVNQLCKRVVELRARLVARNVRDAHLRIAHSLLYLLDKIGLTCPLGPGSRLPLSQATIAAVAGITRQTANRVLRDLQTLGLVHLERDAVCVLDRSALEQLAEGCQLESVRRPAGGCRLVHPDARLTCHPPHNLTGVLVPLKLRRFVRQ